MKYEMLYKRECHFLFGGGTVRSKCLNLLYSKQKTKRFKSGKIVFFYFRHTNYNPLACYDILKMYCMCPQLASSLLSVL